MITGNLIPDHATIARFICRHERALADLFGDVLRLCDRAGLVKPGVVSIDGTRIAGNASPEVSRGFDRISREILAEARATDEAEDDYGDRRGDELPEPLRTPEGRREFLRQAKRELQREDEDCGSTEPEVPLSSKPRPSSGGGGRDATRGCGRASASSSGTAGSIRTRSGAVGRAGCCWRPSDCNQTTTSSGVPTPPMSITARPRATGWVGGPGGRAEPDRPPELPAGKVNTTDPDSRPIPIGFGFVQGYNAQAAVNEQQIVLAAETTNISTDFSQLDPMVTATLHELERAGIDQPPRWSPPTPATGTSSTWTRSWPTSTSRC